MHSVDILLSSAFVLLATVILAFGLALSVVAVKNRRAVSKLEIKAALIVCQGVVSGRFQLICLVISIATAGILYGYDLPLTAISTVYCGVAYMIMSTCFWMTAKHVARFVYDSRASTYEYL